MTDYDKIREILIKLADVLGYDKSNPKHLDAFISAASELEDLINAVGM